MPSIRWRLRSSRLTRPTALLSASVVLAAAPSLAQTQEWIEQFGTRSSDALYGVAEDGQGGAFVVGFTNGDLAAQVQKSDVVLSRFAATGAPLWTVQFGSAAHETGHACAPDGAGGVLLTGYTQGSIGGPHAGSDDAWIARYDESGQRLWTAQIGGVLADTPYAICPDETGGAFVCGRTLNALGGSFGGGYDGWVARILSDGAIDWVVQIGTAKSEWATGITPDGTGGALVVGRIDGPSPGVAQGWLSHYDSAGAMLWTRRIGPVKLAEATCITSDGSGGSFVGGFVWTSTGGGFFDAWIARYDSAGQEAWLREFGGGLDEILTGVAQDGAGGVIGGGFVGEALNPLSHSQIIASRFDADGTHLWSTAFGEAGDDSDCHAVCSDGQGGMILAGVTWDDLGSANLGMSDAWLARYDGSCNPGKTYCTASATSIPGCQASLSATGSPTLSDPSAWTVSSGPVPGGNLGLLLFGSSGPDSTPYGTLGGKLCVAAPTFRTAPESSGGDQGQCSGNYAFTLADLIAASPNATSGATIHAQVWARDPANADGFLLSDGVEVTVCP